MESEDIVVSRGARLCAGAVPARRAGIEGAREGTTWRPRGKRGQIGGEYAVNRAHKQDHPNRPRKWRSVTIGTIRGGMLFVNQYLEIRLLHRSGVSIRQIARQLGHSRGSVRKALEDGVPRGYTRQAPPTSPKLGNFLAVIDQILASDLLEPPKQRHTAWRIFQRLRDEQGYAGGYDQVRRHVQKHRRRERETFLRLEVAPGERLECDFGHIQVDFPEGRREVAVLLGVWSYTHYPFVIALANERWESILHGMICAFEFFGAVPRELWWDNPKTVAQLVLRGRERQVNPHYLALASHYCFAPMFCMPARGQEKSDVERTVFALQRRFATPVPRVKDMDELNRQLLHCCLKERQRIVKGTTQSIGQMFQQELAAAGALPPRPFDGCVIHQRQADKYQCVTFEEVRYSVPRQAAFCPVTLKAYPQQVVLMHESQVVARHRRSRKAGEQVLGAAALPEGPGAQAGLPGEDPAVCGTEAAGGLRPVASATRRPVGRA